MERQRSKKRRLEATLEQREIERHRSQARRLEATPEQQEIERQRSQARRLEATPEQQQAKRQQQQNRRVNVRARRPILFRAAVIGTENAQLPVAHYFGPMEGYCWECGALHFRAEHGRMEHSCCNNGKAMAPPLSPYPEDLHRLLTGDTKESKNFRLHIRQYNIAHAFASFGATFERQPPGRGPYCFRISGEVYHRATYALEVVRFLKYGNFIII